MPTDFDVLLNYETFDIVYISIDFPGVKDILGWYLMFFLNKTNGYNQKETLTSVSFVI